jgi:GT2 family glycosyltransferase
MKAPHERNDAELIADLRDEAATLQHRNLILELELKTIRRDLRRARRNRGYRIANGIARALRSISQAVLRNGFIAPFPRLRDSRSNGATALPCSSELKDLLEMLGAQAVFFTSSTQRNWSVRKLLGVRTNQWCPGPDELKASITSFFAVPQKRPACPKEVPAFACHELIIIDSNDPGMLWPLLKGRFWPHQQILFHGKAPAAELPPTHAGPDFLFYAAPPLSWLDPRHMYLPAFAPWKSAQRRLPLSLPSGNPWPKISVVTPSYNQGKFITATFESVFGQNYPDLEYLVLDGGSTDETRAILDQYRPRLAYSCSQKDNGQADAINKGFGRATGEILAWLNSDDQYTPDALMHVAVAFDTFPEADIVVGACGLLQDGPVPKRIHHSALPFGRVTPLPLAQLLDLENCWLKGHFFYQPEVFCRRRIWEAAGAHVADDLYYCFDYDLWVRMAQAGAKVVHIPDLLALYRVHAEQKTYGDHLPYLPELKLVKSRRDPSVPAHDTLAKA